MASQKQTDHDRIAIRPVPPDRKTPHSIISDGVNEPLLRFGSLSHYAEPKYYDKCYAGRQQDVEFYMAQAAAISNSSVLEYGCGNGRITLPLARQGHTVVGLDCSQPMLESFRARLKSEPVEVRKRVSLVYGDMRKKRLRRRFDLVFCTFNTFLHLYDRVDVEQYLTRVRNQLKPDGKFVFDTSLPLPEELARNPARPYRVPRMKYPPTGQVVKYAEYFDYDAMTQILSVTMRFEPVNAEEPWTALLTHRQFHPREIEALLHYNGLELESVHPDFELIHSTKTAMDSIAWVARVKGK